MFSHVVIMTTFMLPRVTQIITLQIVSPSQVFLHTKEVIIQHFLINLAFQASEGIDHPIDDILAKLQKRGCFKLKSCFTLHKIITSSLQCSCCGTLGNTNSRRAEEKL